MFWMLNDFEVGFGNWFWEWLWDGVCCVYVGLVYFSVYLIVWVVFVLSVNGFVVYVKFECSCLIGVVDNGFVVLFIVLKVDSV